MRHNDNSLYTVNTPSLYNVTVTNAENVHQEMKYETTLRNLDQSSLRSAAADGC